MIMFLQGFQTYVGFFFVVLLSFCLFWLAPCELDNACSMLVVVTTYLLEIAQKSRWSCWVLRFEGNRRIMSLHLPFHVRDLRIRE